MEGQILEFKLIPQYEKYYNESSNWGCYTFTTKDDIPEFEIFKDILNENDNEDIKLSTIAGKMQKLYLGSEYYIKAKLIYNKKYSQWQYEPIIISAIVPKTIENQRMFLESIVTPKQAETLLSVYPNIVEDVINGKDNVDLSLTKGIKEFTWNNIKQKIIENYVISDILVILQPLGVTFTMIKKLIDNEPNPELLKQKLLNNPYMLTEINGLGFTRVDNLALKLVPELRVSYKRTYAFIKYYLYETGENEGHTWVDLDVLESAVRDNIRECEDIFQEIIKIEKDTQALLYIDEDKVGLKYYKDIEDGVYNILKDLDAFERNWDINIEEGIKEAEKEQGFSFTEEQINVIKNALKHNVTFISGKAGCVDCNTEFFNGIEWKRIADYKEGDKVLQYNIDGSAELVYPIYYHKHPSEFLNLIKNKSNSFNQCLSDEHNFLYLSERNRKIILEPFYKIKEKHFKSKNGFYGKVPVTFYYNGKGIDLTDEQIRVMVAVIADGWFGENTNRCRIKLKKERKIKRLEMLLKSANICYKKTITKDGYVNFWFNAPLREKTYSSKWYNCSQKQLNIIIDECLFWDGRINNNMRTFHTTIKETADFIQFAFTACGYKVNMTENNRIGEKYLTNNKEYTRKSKEYTIYIYKNKYNNTRTMKGTQGNKAIISKYKTLDGFKYCFTVPSGMLILRRNNNIFITGNSGKTTISKAILKIYQKANKTIGACALSAKAAQRITEVTEFPASTIHRLLNAKGLNEYGYNCSNPLPYDVILVDECSMINARLYYDLLQAVNFGTKIIMCGDARQLPPIGFGNVFSDLLEKDNIFNVNKLTKVLRQAEMSGILSDANQIREGINPIERPELKIIHGELQDMYYMFRDNRDALNDIAIKTYLKSIEEDGIDEVVIITPRKKDCINSTREINIKIQDLLIDDTKPFLNKGSIKFKLGAKVIQRVNNYEKNIFNGEIGYITDIWKEKDADMFAVQYPNKHIEYTRNELDQIDLAYALTCHLTQGSQYKTAIIIIDNTHYVLLDACLLYTAITRAKKRCLLLAEPSAFKKCINNNKSKTRQTHLKDL